MSAGWTISNTVGLRAPSDSKDLAQQRNAPLAPLLKGVSDFGESLFLRVNTPRSPRLVLMASLLLIA
jgi:hypothetical protein